MWKSLLNWSQAPCPFHLCWVGRRSLQLRLICGSKKWVPIKWGVTVSHIAMIFSKAPESFSRTGDWYPGLGRLNIQIFLIFPQGVVRFGGHVAPLPEVWLGLIPFLLMWQKLMAWVTYRQQTPICLMAVEAGKDRGCRSGLCLVRVVFRQHGDMEGNWQSKGTCEGNRGSWTKMLNTRICYSTVYNS